MYQNSQRGSKIFTPIFPSAVSTQILSSQNNVAPALQLSQPVMAPQTFASQAVVPQVQSVAVPQVQQPAPVVAAPAVATPAPQPAVVPAQQQTAAQQQTTTTQNNANSGNQVVNIGGKNYLIHDGKAFPVQ